MKLLLALAAAAAAPSALALCADLKAKLAAVSIAELASDARLTSPTGLPEQMHLSLTGDATEMHVTFVVNVSAACADAAVSIDGGAASFAAAHSTYSAGVVGWYGSIYTATLTGLVPGSAHTYVATACGGSAAPVTFTAALAPAASLRSRVAVKADMGTVIPLGFETAAQIEKDNAADAFDMVLLAGDLSYATVDPPHNELEEIWDAWGRLIEPYCSKVPFMPNVGNHEHTPGTLTNSSGTFNVDYAAYMARYAAVPRTGNGNLWYSFNHGPVHYTFIDSEEAQSPGSPQLDWILADLAAVDRSVTPWVVMAQHRPLLCSTQSEAGDHVPGGTFLRNLEPALLANKVDLFLTGHEHLYERTHSVNNGTVVARADASNNNTMTDPPAPVYVVQGTAGAFVGGDWMQPQPEWSAVRNGETYGYGIMEFSTAGGMRVMNYAFKTIAGTVLDAFTIKKTVAAA